MKIFEQQREQSNVVKIFFVMIVICLFVFLFFLLKMTFQKERLSLARYNTFCQEHNGTLKANEDCWIKENEITFSKYSIYEDKEGGLYFVK